MRKVVAFLFMVFLIDSFAGDYLIIRYKNGRVQKVELKEKAGEIKSIEFFSPKKGAKKGVVGSKRENITANEKNIKSTQLAREKEDGFEAFERQMRSQLKPTFEGLWKTNFGNLVIKVKGNKVLGLYKNGKGKIEGTLSEDGYTLTGKWSEAPDYLPPKHAGRFYFKLSRTGANFKGKWGFGDEEPDSEWVGRKIK